MRNIIECLDDRALFAGLMDAPSWKPWKTFLKALFALEMDADELAQYRHFTGRQTPPKKPFRYANCVIGRRGGKTRTLAVIACFLACIPDHTAYIVPGENPVIALIAKDRKQARVLLNYVLGTLQSSPMFAPMIVDALAESITLSNGVIIEIHTASIGAPRGRTFLGVFADETAFWDTSADAASPDTEIITAVRPGLSTIPYSLLVVASSPYAKRGILYKNYAQYHGVDDAPVLSWQASTVEMNSNQIDDPLIAEMELEDPERNAAEHGGQFRTDIVAFITRESVESCVAHGLRELPYGEGIAYHAFVDPSGGSADSYTCAISHISPDGVGVLDVVREVKPPFSPAAVTAEFAALIKSYGLNRCTGDAYAGHWPREQFASHGVDYEVSRLSASQIYREFLPSLNAKRVQLLDLPRLTGQLTNLERRTTRGGSDSIAHAPGSHDDVANCVCGTIVHVISDRRPALISRADLVPSGVSVEHKTAVAVFAVVWAGIDGMGAWVLFSYRQHTEPRLLVQDFALVPWKPQVLWEVSRKLDDLCESLTSCFPPSAFLHVPGQLVYEANDAMLDAFTTRLGRADLQFRQIAVCPIETEQVQDTTRLLLSASAHTGSGRVKLSAAASSRNEQTPLLGLLSLPPGEVVHTNPLRMAFLIGVGMLDDRNARSTDGARISLA